LFEEALQFCLFSIGVAFLTLSFKIVWETIKG